ncbi:MAG: hypothetical protein V4555_05425 [Acidobacteriota bacterium]
MQVLPIVLTSWIVVVAALLAVLIYRGHLTRQETDQLFLTDNRTESLAHVEQDFILHRVQALAPYCRWLTVLAILDSLAVVGLFIYQELPAMRGQL